MSSTQSSCCKFICLPLLSLPILISFVCRGVTETADNCATPGPSSSPVKRPEIFLHTQGVVPHKVRHTYFHMSTTSDDPCPRMPFPKMNLTVTSTYLIFVILGSDPYTTMSDVQCSHVPKRHIHPAPPMLQMKTSQMKTVLKTTTTIFPLRTLSRSLSTATMLMIALLKMKVGIPLQCPCL